MAHFFRFPKPLIGFVFVCLGVISQNGNSADAENCNRSFHEVPPASVAVPRAVNTNWFVTGRGLSEYLQELSLSFGTALRALKSDERWIDFGAGKAIAAEDYLTADGLKPSSKASVLAITYKYGRWFPKYRGPKLEIWKGVYFETLTTLPKYRLGTDVFGIFSYTEHLDYYFRLALKHLEVGGKLFISSRFYATSIVLKNGQSVSVAKWLEQIKGLEVDFSRKGVLVVTKKGEVGLVPALRLKSVTKDLPPGRVFEEIQ